jgi:hypothetical protein
MLDLVLLRRLIRDSVIVIIPDYFSSKLVGGNMFRGHLEKFRLSKPAHSYYGSDGMWRDPGLTSVLHPDSFE